VKTWLIDTGPVVAYLDAGDPDHAAVAERLDGFEGRLLSSSAVITEAMHLVSAGAEGPRALSDFVSGSRVEIYDPTRPPDLPAVVSLMERYRNVPMDFADGTLVLLGDALDVRDVLTLDRRGFSVYRTRRGRAFRLVLP
jgi:predicted nucleic acid-binding protein